MRIKQAAIETGLSERTIRFYEEEGLFQPEKQYSNGRYYRSYSAQNLTDLTMLATLRRAGFTMDEIRRMQNEGGVIGDVLAIYKARLKDETAEAIQLTEAAALIDPGKIGSVYELAQCISFNVQKLALPKADVQVRFGRFDEESDEERTAEYERFLKKRDKKRPSFAVVLAAVFGAAALILAAALFIGWQNDRLTAPPTAGTTEGWEYRTEREQGSGMNRLYRESADGNEEMIFSRDTTGVYDSGRFSFYVGAEHVYLNIGETLYSINADGSGLHLIRRRGGETDYMTEYGGNLYFIANNGGNLGRSLDIITVLISGGRRKTLVRDIHTHMVGVAPYNRDNYLGFVIEKGVLFAELKADEYIAIDLATSKKENLGRSLEKDIFEVIEEYFGGKSDEH